MSSTNEGQPDRPRTTGSFAISLNRAEGGTSELIKTLARVVGRPIATGGECRTADAETSGAIVFEKAGIAVIEHDPDETAALRAALEKEPLVASVEDELVAYPIDSEPEGTHDAPPRDTPASDTPPHFAEAHVVPAAAGGTAENLPAEAPAVYFDNDEFSWGLQAVGVDGTQFTGRGIRVAVLDSGFDLEHPDFQDRAITSYSFLDGNRPEDDGDSLDPGSLNGSSLDASNLDIAIEGSDDPADDAGTVVDRDGHGTHATGTACGPANPADNRRYGVAPDCEIFVGKVYRKNQGVPMRWVYNGVDWAIDNDCAVVSISIGVTVETGGAYPDHVETMAREALDQGTLIVAAAGNGSDRPDTVRPVMIPANAPSIMAVGALRWNEELWWRSNGGVNPDGGEVDLVAPGQYVFSAAPRPRLHTHRTGTSMATPHVAGIAALHAEADPDARGRRLWQRLIESARALPNLSARDGGAGLVQAP